MKLNTKKCRFRHDAYKFLELLFNVLKIKCQKNKKSFRAITFCLLFADSKQSIYLEV